MIPFEAFRIREARYAPGLRQRRHAHDHSNVTILVAGQIEEATERGTYCARPFSVVAKAAGCEHEDQIGGFGARAISIELAAGSPLIHAGSWAWHDDEDVVRIAIGVARAFDSGRHADLEHAAVSLIERVGAERHATAPPPWLAEMRSLLDERFDEPLRFDAIARDFGLHPVYVSRAFLRHTGLSMSAYVRAARLRHARQALASSRRSIAAIAFESGFSDPSHLCRTFVRSFGVTPKIYRRLITFHSAPAEARRLAS